MDCLEYRRLIGADPRLAEKALIGHRGECEACRAFTNRVNAFDARLKQAMSVSFKPRANSQSAPANDRLAMWLGVAASLVLGIGLAVATWYTAPHGSIGADLVAHTVHESRFMVANSEPVPLATLDEVLREAGASMSLTQPVVSYARTCLFRGRFVPHLIVQGDNGPVTVMILPDIEVEGPSSFSENGYFGTILPASKGSIAVVAGETNDLLAIAESFQQGLSWDI